MVQVSSFFVFQTLINLYLQKLTTVINEVPSVVSGKLVAKNSIIILWGKILRYLFTYYLVQVGACIVNSERKIVGIGYNGMPNRCSDDELPWQREADDRLDTKYPYGKPL